MKILIQVRKLLVLVLLSSTVCACSTAELRDAQSHFSAGASAENRQTFSDLTQYQIGATESAQQAVITDYQLAYAIANELVNNPGAAAKLSSDGLLGTAYMIKVYSAWRILALHVGSEQVAGEDDGNSGVEFEQLIAQVQAEHAAGKITLGKRDEVMLEAFPGLIEHERALRANDWDLADRLFLSAYCNIGKAAEKAPQDHDVRAYLYMAQIQTLGAWGRALARFFSPKSDRRKKEKTRINGFARTPICGLKPRIDSAENNALSTAVIAQLRAIGTSYQADASGCPIELPAECRL